MPGRLLQKRMLLGRKCVYSVPFLIIFALKNGDDRVYKVVAVLVLSVTKIEPLHFFIGEKRAIYKVKFWGRNEMMTRVRHPKRLNFVSLPAKILSPFLPTGPL